MNQRSEQEIMQNWKTNDKPLVSISCITYNHELYIGEAIDSFLIQETDFPFEVLVHDDCSTDNTANIIREYEKKYPNIIKPIYQKENQYSKGIKISPTFNFPRAKGEYIALCEGDDYWTDPLKLQKQTDFLDKHEEYIVTYHQCFIVNENNTVLAKEKHPGAQNYDRETMICGDAFILTCTALFRNVQLQYSDSLKSAFNGDTVFWHLLGYYGKCKYQKNIKSAGYRVHKGSVWSSLKSIEKIKKGYETKQILKKNIYNNSDFEKKINDSIKSSFVNHLAYAIYSFDFDAYKTIIMMILKDEEINTYSILATHTRDVIGKTINKLFKLKQV